MPEEPRRRQIGGDDIISEILRNAEGGKFPMRRTVLLPCVFHVYLPQADFQLIRPVIPALKQEAASALREHLDQLNHQPVPSKAAKLFGFDKSAPAVEYRILDSTGFTIEFFPDLDGGLEPGDIEVRSELAAPDTPDFDGAQTRQVTRKQGAVSFSEPVVAPPTAPVPPQGDETVRSADVPSSTTSTQPVYAWLRYSDADGTPRTFPVSRNEIAIGRGGKTVWVDVQLNAPPDVSREHCRIRRDSQGEFYVSDVSQFGTTLDGRRLPQNAGGAPSEVRLPSRAKLVLADLITLEFEKTGAK